MESESTNSEALINSFSEIASATKEEARFFLESHKWDLDAALSTFLDAGPIPQPSRSPSPEYAPSRSRSPSPAAPSRRPRTYDLRSRKPSSARVRTLSDLNRPGRSDTDNDDDGDDDDDHDHDKIRESYTGGEKSGMVVQDPTRDIDTGSIFNQMLQSGRGVPAESLPPQPSSSRSFTGNARLLTGETITGAPPLPPTGVHHTVTLWRNGFSVDDGPLRTLNDPANFAFLESIRKSECPEELAPSGQTVDVPISLRKREEDYPEPVKRKETFQGVGRTLGSGGEESASGPQAGASSSSSVVSAPAPSMGLIVDESLPSTSLQLRLADGTRMVSRFNYHHTIRDIRSFINASRPGGPRNYQLQIMGFPPKQLGDLSQTIDQAGVANSVVIQKL